MGKHYNYITINDFSIIECYIYLLYNYMKTNIFINSHNINKNKPIEKKEKYIIKQITTYTIDVISKINTLPKFKKR